MSRSEVMVRQAIKSCAIDPAHTNDSHVIENLKEMAHFIPHARGKTGHIRNTDDFIMSLKHMWATG